MIKWSLIQQAKVQNTRFYKLNKDSSTTADMGCCSKSVAAVLLLVYVKNWLIEQWRYEKYGSKLNNLIRCIKTNYPLM